MERAIGILEKAHGHQSPLLPIHLINFGSVLARKGSYEKARALLQRCDRLLVDIHGEDSRQRVTPLVLLGRILVAFDRPWEAESVLREALALASAHELGSTSRLEISLAKALHLQGRDPEAWLHAKQVLSKVDPGEATEDSLRIEVLIVSGGVAREVGALEEADRYHRQAGQLVERMESALQHLEFLVESAETQLALRQQTEARSLLEDGLALIRPQIDRGLASRLYFALARAVSESEPTRARELATAAQSLLQEHNRLHHRLDEAISSFRARELTSTPQPMLPGRKT